jgi:hypothetical protein
MSAGLLHPENAAVSAKDAAAKVRTDAILLSWLMVILLRHFWLMILGWDF